MTTVKELVDQAAASRRSFIQLVSDIPEPIAQTRPSEDRWSVVENAEHLFWAEVSGVSGLWRTLFAIRSGAMPRTLESDHRDMTIEEIIDQTWQPKEQVPPIAAPKLNSTLAYWTTALKNLQPVLEAFGNELKEDELRLRAQPHPISGHMDFQQRLEFIRFHIDRHAEQVKEVLQKLGHKA
jgi:hypothetical protein